MLFICFNSANTIYDQSRPSYIDGKPALSKPKIYCYLKRVCLKYIPTSKVFLIALLYRPQWYLSFFPGLHQYTNKKTRHEWPS